MPLPDGSRVLAIDLGGTKTAVGLVAGDGSILAKDTAATPLGDSAAAYETMLRLSRKLLAEGGPVSAIGLALPGVVDRGRGSLIHSPSSGWRDLPFGSMLSEALSLPVSTDNDVNACAWAEYLFGAGRALDCFFWITVSTGIGGAVFVGDRVLQGASGMAGEIGHFVAIPGGQLCGCGHRGCLEAEAAGPAWRRCALGLLEEGGGGVLSRVPRDSIDAKTIAEAARGGDRLCLEVVKRMGETLGKGLAAIVNILDPASIIMGGGVAEAFDLLQPHMTGSAARLCLSGGDRPLRVQASALGYDAALIGAAALALRPY
ncbi:MAG TPA: ROK family protein [Rectinemataceae bacterium]|nr:ROK family protein [Rectinemataceae bacterium]